jgi:hypothetical protein
VVQIEAGCGDAGTVPVEIRNLRVEGLDTNLAPTAKDGSEVADQVNTVSFNVTNLPAGGHVVLIDGNPLLLNRFSAQCVVDDLTDTGEARLGIAVTSPVNLSSLAGECRARSAAGARSRLSPSTGFR